MRRAWVFCILYFTVCTHCFPSSVLSDIAQYVDFFAKKDAVISKNIANASTPGYIPLELHPTERSSIALYVTNPSHMHYANDSEFEVTEKRDIQVTIDGNGVDLQKELTQKDTNAAALKSALHIYNKARSITKLATNDK